MAKDCAHIAAGCTPSRLTQGRCIAQHHLTWVPLTCECCSHEQQEWVCSGTTWATQSAAAAPAPFLTMCAGLVCRPSRQGVQHCSCQQHSMCHRCCTFVLPVRCMYAVCMHNHMGSSELTCEPDDRQPELAHGRKDGAWLSLRSPGATYRACHSPACEHRQQPAP